MLAACTDWHRVRRFHVGTDHNESTSDTGYTTACAPSVISIDQFPCFLGESIYAGLAGCLVLLMIHKRGEVT